VLSIMRDSDADMGHFRDQAVVVLGYEYQGRSQDLNLRDSRVGDCPVHC
jgi:ketol-acid reductoisomerase